MKHSLRKAYAETADGQLHYAEAGSGEHLVLLGETPRSYRFFERLMPLLAPYFHVVAPDLPGLGNSYSLPAPASVPAMANGIAGFLDALGMERTHVFGMHTGNKVAAALAADHPRYLNKLILAGQPHSILPDEAARRAVMQPIFDRYHSSQNEMSDPKSRMLREWLNIKLTLDAGWWPEKLLTGLPVDPELLLAAEAKAIDFLLGWRSVAPIYEAVFAFDLAEAVSRIPASALILELMPREEEHLGSQAEALAGLMKHARAMTIPITHGAAMENQRDEIAHTLLTFLNETEAH